MGWGRDAPGLSHTGLSASFCSQQNREREGEEEEDGGRWGCQNRITEL